MKFINNTWKFPENIGFDQVNDYLRIFEKLDCNETITFDLTETENIHSSFIGFLIHARRRIDKESGKLMLLVSPSIEKIFTMLNLNDYWDYSRIARTA